MAKSRLLGQKQAMAAFLKVTTWKLDSIYGVLWCKSPYRALEGVIVAKENLAALFEFTFMPFSGLATPLLYATSTFKQ